VFVEDESMIVLLAYTIITLLVCWVLLGEFSYFGREWNHRLYDWQAATYELKWSKPAYRDEELNRRLFVDPVLSVNHKPHDLRVLDLACGTGRFTRLLLESGKFQGSIDAVDQSEKMLAIMRQHLQDSYSRNQVRVNTVQAEALEYCTSLDPRASYHAISILEASELISDFGQVLLKCCNHLHPEGILLFTVVRPWIAWLLPFRPQRIGKLRKTMQQAGVDLIEVKRWHPRYDLVVARKPVTCERDDIRGETQQVPEQQCYFV
jgi:SAM-dependent methyltransferase